MAFSIPLFLQFFGRKSPMSDSLSGLKGPVVVGGAVVAGAAVVAGSVAVGAVVVAAGSVVVGAVVVAAGSVVVAGAAVVAAGSVVVAGAVVVLPESSFPKRPQDERRMAERIPRRSIKERYLFIISPRVFLSVYRIVRFLSREKSSPSCILPSFGVKSYCHNKRRLL